jgi:hypothetical protein
MMMMLTMRKILTSTPTKVCPGNRSCVCAGILCLCTHSHACNAPAQPAAAKPFWQHACHAQALQLPAHPVDAGFDFACVVCMLMCLQTRRPRRSPSARRHA